MAPWEPPLLLMGIMKQEVRTKGPPPLLGAAWTALPLYGPLPGRPPLTAPFLSLAPSDLVGTSSSSFWLLT